MVPSSGGMAKAVRDFQRALDAPVVSFTSEKYLRAEGSAVPGAVHVPVPDTLLGQKFSWVAAAARAEADALAKSADLLTCHMLYRYHTHWVSGWAARRHLPYWVVPHGSLDPYTYTYRTTQKKLWMGAFGRNFLARAAAVIFSTEQERRKAALHYDGPNVRVIHWPVDPLELAGAETARANLRARLGLTEQSRLLLYLGRLHEKKRPLETVAAVAASGSANVHLAVLGGDETISAATVRAAGERFGLGARLHVPGPVYGAEKEAWLHACDGFISLSRQENFGYSAAEALSAGRPVILSPGNDLAGDLAPLHCGWFLQDDLPATAAAAIREWAATPAADLRERGARGLDFVRRELSFARFAEKLRGLEAETLARPRA